MLGRTHKKIAVATAFAVIQPTTVPACLGVLAAGAIGGEMCDIDILFRNFPAKDEDPYRDDHYDGKWEDVASNVILFLLFVLVDGYFSNSSIEWFFSHFGFQTLAAGAVFTLIVVCGTMAPHRSYMHSIFVGAVLSGCLYVVCAPLAPAFAVGFATHLLLDFVNKSGMPLFWPIRKRFNLNLCSANKTTNSVLETIGEVLCDLLVSYFLIVAFLDHSQAYKILEILRAPYSDGISNLGAWLVFINILTFFIESINFSRWLKGKWPYQNHDEYFNSEKDDATTSFVQRNIYVLFVLGGAIGGLLSYIWIFIWKRKYIKNGALGFAIPAFGAVCIIIEWGCIYLAVMKPTDIVAWLEYNLSGINAVYLSIYIVVINIIAFIVYSQDGIRINHFTLGNFFSLFVGFVGGAAGGLLAINLKGYFSNQKFFKNTVMKMVQTQCLMIALAVVIATIGM